jgi:hypothetical protein
MMTKQLTPEQAAILAEHFDAIAWHGGECPVDPESKPEMFFAWSELNSASRKACGWDWGVSNGNKVIAYIPDPDYPMPEVVVRDPRGDDLISRQAAIESVRGVLPGTRMRGNAIVAAINAIDSHPRPRRQDARDMLADMNDWIDYSSSGLSDGYYDNEPPVQAILDAIAGEE